MSTYEASPIKRRRRSTKAEMIELRKVIHAVAEETRPATVRHIFYRLVSVGVIDKTEKEYGRVQRLLTIMRRDWWRYLGSKNAQLGAQAVRAAIPDKDDVSDSVAAIMASIIITAEFQGDDAPDGATLATCVPFDWIADNTRWTRKPSTFSGLGDYLANGARTYRRALWDDSEVYVEVWCESDSIASVIHDVTWKYDIPLQVVRGFSSVSYLYGAAQAIAETGKPAHLYYFGDYDPSGTSIEKSVEEGLRLFAEDADIRFERVAVTPEQIETWNLPTKPPKKSDSRSKTFKGGTVEIEAIAPDDLRGLVHQSVEQHLDRHQLKVLEVAEAEEKKFLLELAGEEEVAS